MNGISRIELGFENCEAITIDGKYIGDFDVFNIHTDINRMGCNYIGKIQSCDSFIIEIYRDANTINRPFGIEDEFGVKTFERILMYNDITSITVYYDEKDENHNDIETSNSDCIYAPYQSEDDDQLGSPNIYQSTYINSFGDLYIVIDKEKKIFDLFNEKEINDSYGLNFKFRMYDIISKK
jgi:hypothetical protein